MFEVLREPNHLNALLFSALLVFSGFTVIPYITIYAVGNVGISLQDIPYIYLAGGAATLFTARLIGHWADLRGKIKIYRLVAVAALLPLLVVTHIGAAPLWLWLVCTTAFFVLVSGRMIPGDGHHHFGGASEIARHLHVAECHGTVALHGFGHNAGRIHHHAKRCRADFRLWIGGDLLR